MVEDHGLGRGEGWLGDHSEDERISAFRSWGLDEDSHVAKVHVLTEEEIDEFSNWEEQIVLFHTYRDLRDVAVSLRKKFHTNDKDIIKSLDQSTELMNVLEERFSGLLLSQKYEDLREDLRLAIVEHSNFLNIPIDEKYLDALGNDLSLKGLKAVSGVRHYLGKLMKVLPNRLSNLQTPWNEKTLYHPGHVSDHKGVEGVWKEELSGEMASLIEERYKNWMLEKTYI